MTTEELIYTYIRDYIEEEGYPPDYREIAIDCSISMGTVTYTLDKLESDGFITRQPRRWRSMKLTDKEWE
jgi:repressor LexA